MWAEFEKGSALAWNQFVERRDLHGWFENVFGWGVINVNLSVVECVATVEFFFILHTLGTLLDVHPAEWRSGSMLGP